MTKLKAWVRMKYHSRLLNSFGVKSDFTGFLEEFHENGRLVRRANNSFIDMIPKKENP